MLESRIGAHQQHAPPLRHQVQRGGAGERGLAHASLAGEEKESAELGREMRAACSRSDEGAEDKHAALQPQQPPEQQLPALSALAAAGAARPAQRAKLGARGSARQHDLAVHQSQRQRLPPCALQESLDRAFSASAIGCCARLKRSSAPFWRAQSASAGEVDEVLVHIGAAHAAAAAQGRVEIPDGAQVLLVSMGRETACRILQQLLCNFSGGRLSNSSSRWPISCSVW